MAAGLSTYIDMAPDAARDTYRDTAQLEELARIVATRM
jgi:hypothetical protein